MAKHAIFFGGPIGVGKTTLGRALAARLCGVFIDGDDHSDPDRPWYCSILRTSKAIVEAGLTAFEQRSVVVIAYPLGCMNWIFFKRRFGDVGVRPHFVSLSAAYSSIVATARGRKFTDDEHARIQVMITEGYGARPFSDLIFQTDRDDFSSTLARLENEVRRMISC